MYILHKLYKYSCSALGEFDTLVKKIMDPDLFSKFVETGPATHFWQKQHKNQKK